ncbi:MAG TPA: MBL fold metallo-hydrolase [Rhodocyclaceae bacterium]|nr:MBL fold metallo-hydrolase [Rhodocyclaceae bacterium]
MVYFRQILAASSDRYSYLLTDLNRREAIIIDPAADQVLLYQSLLKEIRATLVAVLLTHSHGALSPGLGELLVQHGAQLFLGEGAVLDSLGAGLERGWLCKESLLGFGDETVLAWPTPGHTLGSVCFFWRDRVFTGDTLLIGESRAECDDADAASLFDSVTQRLLPLPDETLIYPGRRTAERMVSCIGEQRGRNPLLGGMTRDEFIAAEMRLHASAQPSH